MGPKFITDFDPAHGEMIDVSPLLRRLVCNNPSKFTFHGNRVERIGFPKDRPPFPRASHRGCGAQAWQQHGGHGPINVRMGKRFLQVVDFRERNVGGHAVLAVGYFNAGSENGDISAGSGGRSFCT